MIIQIDSREKERAIKKIVAEFDNQGIQHPVSKLMVGDYMNYDNPRLIIDRKQDLNEVCGNLTQQHKRFRNEVLKCNELGIRLIVLIEHGGNINSMDSVRQWKNPRQYKYERSIREYWGIPRDSDFETEVSELKKHGAKINRGPLTGEELAKKMETMSEKYGIQWEFCDKKNTGKRIIELLKACDDCES